MPNDRVVTTVRMHLAAIISLVLLILGGAILAGLVTGAAHGNRGLVLTIWMLWGVLFVWQGWKVAIWWRRYFVVTENRLMLIMDQAMPRYGITVPDRQLACTPVGSPEGRRYLGAMAAAANYGRANRQLLAEATRRVFSDMTGAPVHLVYDVSHNLATIETHAGTAAVRPPEGRDAGTATRPSRSARGPARCRAAGPDPQDVTQVVEAAKGAGLCRKVARLVPLGVVKG